ncbi:DUF485 domain-containing protein [Amycolatopsis sp. H20-H5]|uniref:DUF485 domain-containing protein n=1 Tax=Amycolatopsis sp. H20-H5 TaxID=3046309 RepID=UPI002DBACEEA|nr:DUF485 domain-containing protein [Amycolatopsis sp. H20-H5]MEC3973891.1 DUF485 domain-containing protein [Amycolatopsis sp. H20-H5]
MHNVARTPAASNALEETGQMPVMFEKERPARPPRTRQGPDYDRIQHSKEFVALRKRFRRFVFPMSLAFFAWYMTYVFLAAYAHDFMSTKVFGQINVGIILGIGQFASTIVIMVAYLRFANRRIDPEVAAIRRQAGLEDK